MRIFACLALTRTGTRDAEPSDSLAALVESALELGPPTVDDALRYLVWCRRHEPGLAGVPGRPPVPDDSASRPAGDFLVSSVAVEERLELPFVLGSLEPVLHSLDDPCLNRGGRGVDAGQRPRPSLRVVAGPGPAGGRGGAPPCG